MLAQFFKRLFSTLTYQILPTVFWLAVIWGFDKPYVACLTLLSALLHEIGHLIAINHYSKKYSLPHGRLFGFKITKGAMLAYGEEAIVYAAGPLANFTAALFTIPLLSLWGEYACLLFYINLCTAISNLLPCEGYDGYGIARAVRLSYKSSLRSRQRPCS